MQQEGRLTWLAALLQGSALLPLPAHLTLSAAPQPLAVVADGPAGKEAAPSGAGPPSHVAVAMLRLHGQPGLRHGLPDLTELIAQIGQAVGL